MADTILGLFLIVLILACIACFSACGVLFIMYDMCPIIERLGIVGATLGMLIFGIGITQATTNAVPCEDEEEVKDEVDN